MGVGISDNDGGSERPSLAISSGGTPYVAWNDGSSGDAEIYVRRWSGTEWEEVGPGSATDGGISDNDGWSAWASMSIAADGTPYVVWNDGTPGGGNVAIYVRRWTGG